jgi:hypothetical protein
MTFVFPCRIASFWHCGPVGNGDGMQLFIEDCSEFILLQTLRWLNELKMLHPCIYPVLTRA